MIRSLPTYLLLVCMLISCRLKGQEVDRAALLQALETEVQPTKRFDLIRDLGFSYENSDLHEAERYYKQNLNIALQLNNCGMLSKTYCDLGNVSRNASLYKQAEQLHRLSLQAAIRCNDSLRMAVARGNLSNVFQLSNQLDSSIRYSLQALPYFEEQGDSLRMLIIYSNLTGFYHAQHQFENALTYGEKCIRIGVKTGSFNELATTYMTLAGVHAWIGKMDKAGLFCKRAMDLAPRMDDLMRKTLVYQNISTFCSQQNKAAWGNRYADSCLVYGRKLDNPNVLASCLLAKGIALVALSQMDAGETYLNECLKLALADGEWMLLRELYLNKSKIAFHRKDYKQAYTYLDAHITYKDSTFNKDVSQRMSELEAKYQSERKARKLEELVQQNALSQLQAAETKRLNYLFIGMALLGLMGSGLLYVNFKRKLLINQQQEEIQHQKIKDLENEKQLVAMDSIIKGEEQERSRVAKDLHDGLGSLLSGVKLSLSSMKGNVVIGEEYAHIFNSSIQQLDNAIGEMRRVAHNMMPESLLRFGLVQAIQNLCDGLNESGSIVVHLEHHNFSDRLQGDQEVTTFRMVQELLTNALKHANAKQIIVQLSKHEHMVNVVVEDDGVGFDVETLQSATGAGYENLKHRVNYLKGSLDIKSEIGKGTSILIEFPE